ncbi:hypothetical protein AB5N19_11387 [Seiridium cardinale]|uniref:Uncharacterized protein n=1 Tax=Seiridium cardinale TaxID=138064 RepID=A0ABR2X9U7_9PEZI
MPNAPTSAAAEILTHVTLGGALLTEPLGDYQKPGLGACSYIPSWIYSSASMQVGQSDMIENNVTDFGGLNMTILTSDATKGLTYRSILGGSAQLQNQRYRMVD